MKRKKEDLVVEQNEFWRKETTLTHDKQQFSTELRNKESQLHGMIGRSTLNGINAIKDVRKRFQQQGRHDLVEGYLGTLIDCFKTEQSFFTAVEVTAGSRLFHHVVSTSAIGNSYLQEMNKMKLSGEVTFLPLDRLQVSQFKKNIFWIFRNLLEFFGFFLKAEKMISGATRKLSNRVGRVATD